jgi:hypothetical protein
MVSALLADDGQPKGRNPIDAVAESGIGDGRARNYIHLQSLRYAYA